MLMAEWHRLIAHDAGAGDIIRADEFGPGPASDRHTDHETENGELRNGVEAAMEHLGHWHLPVFPHLKGKFRAGRARFLHLRLLPKVLVGTRHEMLGELS